MAIAIEKIVSQKPGAGAEGLFFPDKCIYVYANEKRNIWRRDH
jgi:hypothetical protein